MNAFDIAKDYARRSDWLLVVLDEKIKITKRILDTREPRIETHVFNLTVHTR